MKPIIYVQHCLIPPVTLQTIPRASLSHGQRRRALQLRIADGLATNSQKKVLGVEKTLVIVFDEEARAYAASHALRGMEDPRRCQFGELAIIV